jgi:hypothetical protein
MRATVSIGPPAANGTIIVTGRVGQFCACAGVKIVGSTLSAATSASFDKAILP